jgi:hypothetical protein
MIYFRIYFNNSAYSQMNENLHFIASVIKIEQSVTILSLGLEMVYVHSISEGMEVVVG